MSCAHLKVFPRREPWNWNDLAFYVLGDDGREQFLAQPLVMAKHEPGTIMAEPTFRLGETEAQALMDMLWDCGLRPTEGHGSAGALKATQDHLKDMQTLTMRLLGKVAP